MCNFYVHFTKIAPIMPAFCSLLLPIHYAKNFASEIDGSLSVCGMQQCNKISGVYYIIVMLVPVADLGISEGVSGSGSFQSLSD